MQPPRDYCVMNFIKGLARIKLVKMSTGVTHSRRPDLRAAHVRLGHQRMNTMARNVSTSRVDTYSENTLEQGERTCFISVWEIRLAYIANYTLYVCVCDMMQFKTNYTQNLTTGYLSAT